MTVPKELEIKLALAPASLPRLKSIPLIKSLKKPPRRATEVSVYFDTGKHKLRRKGLMLRVRRKGTRYVQTIKAAGDAGPFERDEWEHEVANRKPDLSRVDGDLKSVMSDKLRRRLKPMFETRVQRTIYPLTNDARTIELAIDRGKIDTGENAAPLCEIELELKRGDKAELFNVARELIRALPAQLALKSKSDRGYELIDGERDAPAKSTPIDLSLCANTREGFQAIGRACLRQVVDNGPALLKGDPEGVHQMRVGLRRLRAAMSLFSGILDDPQTAAVKAELKWLTGELSPAREFEVLKKRVIAPLRKIGKARRRGVAPLSKEVDTRRDSALERAQKAVMSDRFSALTLETAAWLETGDWTRPADDLVRSRGDQPINASAAEQLRRRWRKVRKRGKRLAELDAQSRHKLRIQVKKLRYATEFFGDLLGGKQASKRRRKFVTALEGLQDGLGDLNDIVVDEKLISGLRGRRASRKRAFAAGLLTGREDASLDTAMAAATQGYAKLAKLKPFWR